VEVYENMCGPYHERRYLTREEKIPRLKEYKEEPENELKGVAERIKELKIEELGKGGRSDDSPIFESQITEAVERLNTSVVGIWRQEQREGGLD